MKDGAIFISHAASDEQVIREFFVLLQTGCDLRQKAISCTSIEGADVGTGEKFVEWIEEHLARAELVILFVTPSYLDSRFCVAEMGAAWALKKPVHPLVTPGVDRDLGTVMLGRQTEKVDSTGLDKLYTKISSLTQEPSSKVEHWNVQKRAFLERFDKLFPNLPRPQTVSQEELQSVENELRAAMQIKEEYRDRIRTLEDQVALLERAKDVEEVAAIKRQFDSENGTYRALISEVRQALKQLDSVEVRCLYASQVGSGWQPNRDTVDTSRTAIDRALSTGSISIDEYDDHKELRANTEHPRYEKSVRALRKLELFIDEEASSELVERLESETRTFIGLKYQDYWEALYGQRLLD